MYINGEIDTYHIFMSLVSYTVGLYITLPLLTLCQKKYDS